MSTLPIYTHDCHSCVFLGNYADEDGTCDLYFCSQGGSRPTVIARYSDEGPDYQSGLEAGRNGDIESLAEAYRRAKDLKLIA